MKDMSTEIDTGVAAPESKPVGTIIDGFETFIGGPCGLLEGEISIPACGNYNTDKFTEWQDMAYRQLRTNQLQQLERMAIRECEKISGNIVPSMPPRLMYEIERREAIRMRMEKLGVDIE